MSGKGRPRRPRQYLRSWVESARSTRDLRSLQKHGRRTLGLLGLHDRATDQMNRSSTSFSTTRAMSTLAPNWPSGSISTTSPDHTAITMGKRLTKRSEKNYRNMKRFPARSPTLQGRTRDRCGLDPNSYQQSPRRYHSPALLHAATRLRYDGKVLPTRSGRKPRTETPAE
jgi:hypothetical protein